MTTTLPIIQFPHNGQHTGVPAVTDRGDPFMLTAQAAVRACQAIDQTEAFTAQFVRLHDKLAAWINAHDAHIVRAFLTAHDNAILLLLVQKTEAFDQKLIDALADLDIAVAQDDEYNLIRLNVLALPLASDEAIQPFLAARSLNF